MLKAHLDTSDLTLPATPQAATETPPLLGLLASGASVPGPELARRLGISRAAVWKQVEAWRAAGLDIETGHRGYRLVWPLDALDMARLQAALPAGVRKRIGMMQNFWRLDSTSSELARRAAELPDLSFVFADWQQAGRGRRGRNWVSPPATNLQFSCLKRFASGYAALAGLSLAAGIAAVRALEDCGVRGVGLKWPNDLVHDDAKLGGILVELGGEFMGPCHAIIGIGINVHLPAALRATLGRPCVDVAGLCKTRPSRGVLAAALVRRLVETLDTFDRSGFAAFAEDWTRRDVLIGRRIRVEGAHGTFDGVARGVDARGALQVRAAGAMRSVDSAEVSVRPA